MPRSLFSKTDSEEPMKKAKTDSEEPDPAVDLSTLEYPRHVHKAGGAYRVVADAETCAAALDDGWALQPPPVTA